jgi:hypothetical protein
MNCTLSNSHEQPIREANAPLIMDGGENSYRRKLSTLQTLSKAVDTSTCRPEPSAGSQWRHSLMPVPFFPALLARSFFESSKTTAWNAEMSPDFKSEANNSISTISIAHLADLAFDLALVRL